MPVKVYKRSDASRSIPYQDKLLAPIVPGWPNVPTFFDADRDMLTRPTRRSEKATIYAASFALFADDEDDMLAFLKACKARGVTLIGVEENIEAHPHRSSVSLLSVWKLARRSGAAMRGAQMSAASKKAKTAERFALIADRWPLPSKDHPAKALLKEAGIKSINTVNNLHNGKTREDFQREYQASLKRKARRQKAKVA